MIVYTWSTKSGFERDAGGSHGSTSVILKVVVLVFFAAFYEFVAVPVIVTM